MEPLLTIDLISLFPSMVSGFLEESMLGRAQKHGVLKINSHNLRDCAEDKHKLTDDRPFGGGAGMVLKPEPLGKAIESLKREHTKVVYLCPDGKPLKTSIGKTLAKESHIILISGHYEGVDQRIRDLYVDEEISIGDYILTNGTVAAAVLIDVVARFVPGVLGEEKSLDQDSFSDSLLTFPQYTRPLQYNGMGIPSILLSGNHQKIDEWRKQQRVQKTLACRPDLISN